MDSFFLIWIFSVLFGCAIGAARDRVISAFFLCLFAGPLGVLLVLCLPNLQKQKEEAERKAERKLVLHLQLQQAKLLDPIRRSVPPPPRCEPKLRIASNGQDLGEMSVATVKLMLKSGKLTQQDYYFDPDSDDWMQLDRCPALD